MQLNLFSYAEEGPPIIKHQWNKQFSQAGKCSYVTIDLFLQNICCRFSVKKKYLLQVLNSIYLSTHCPLTTLAPVICCIDWRCYFKTCNTCVALKMQGRHQRGCVAGDNSGIVIPIPIRGMQTLVSTITKDESLQYLIKTLINYTFMCCNVG